MNNIPEAERISIAELIVAVASTALLSTRAVVPLALQIVDLSTVVFIVARASFTTKVVPETSLSSNFSNFFTLRIINTRLIVNTDGGRMGVSTFDLAGVLTPNANIGIDGTHGSIGSLDATTETFSIVRIPNAINVSLAKTRIFTMLTEAGVSTTTSETPFTSSFTIDLDIIADLAAVVVFAHLFARTIFPLASMFIPNIVVEGSAVELILGIVGAPIGDASLVECPPFASSIVSTGDDVCPSALSTNTCKCSYVPDADRIRVADFFLMNLAAARTTRSSLSSPFTIRISITSTISTPTEEAAVNASFLIRFELTLIRVFKADVGGEVFTLLAALTKLGDPSTSLSRVAGSSVDVDGTRSIAESLGVIPHTEGAVVARITRRRSKLTGLDTTIERSLETSIVVDADVTRKTNTLVLALSELGIPLAGVRVTREFIERSGASVESTRTSRSFNTSGSGVARRRDGSASETTRSRSVSATSLGVASGTSWEIIAGVSTRTFRPHALGVGEAASLSDDLRTFGFTAGDCISPFTSRITVARGFGGVGNGTLGLASTRASMPVTDLEARLTRTLRRLEFTSRFTSSREGVPHTFRIEGASTDVGVVTVSTLGTTSFIASIPLTVAVSKTLSRITPEGAGDLASLTEAVPLTSRLGVAGRLVGHGLTAHDADRLGAVPLTEGVSIARTLLVVFDGALCGADEEARIPFTNILVVEAFRFRLDARAFLLTSRTLGVPFAALVGIEFTRSLGVVTRSRASTQARQVVHSRGIAENISSTITNIKEVAAVVFTEVQASIPVAVVVIITITRGRIEVTIFATRDADCRSNTRSDGTETVGIALLHVHDCRAGSITNTFL